MNGIGNGREKTREPGSIPGSCRRMKDRCKPARNGPGKEGQVPSWTLARVSVMKGRFGSSTLNPGVP